MRDLSNLLLTADVSILDAVAAIDRNERGIVLVVDGERRLLDTVTDGDIRRAMLAGIAFDTPIGQLASRRRHSPYPAPVTAPVDADRAALLLLMNAQKLRHLPLLDRDGRVVDLVVLEDLVAPVPSGLQAVVMAGGYGSRLRPLTNELPKPMLPVGGKPVLEITLAKLQQAGVRRVNVATFFRPEKIEEYFGNGERFGVELTYIREGSPLGTAGALGLIERPSDRLLVINGDILTDLDFRALLAFHVEHGADLTMAVRRYETEVPYGVVECDGPRVTSLTEKPSLNLLVNAGIYLLEPRVFEHIETGVPLNMTDLIDRVIKAGQSVVSFPIREYWLDIGHHDDYARAQTDAAVPPPIDEAQDVPTVGRGTGQRRPA
jgi:dTDP-glucose pyrophosphorylase